MLSTGKESTKQGNDDEIITTGEVRFIKKENELWIKSQNGMVWVSTMNGSRSLRSLATDNVAQQGWTPRKWISLFVADGGNDLPAFSCLTPLDQICIIHQ